MAKLPSRDAKHEDNLPERWKEYASLNAEMVRQSPNIAEKQEPLQGEQCVGTKK